MHLKLIILSDRNSSKKCKQTADQLLPEDKGMGRLEGEITEGHEGTFAGDGYVHYLDGSGGFMSVFIHLNL